MRTLGRIHIPICFVLLLAIATAAQGDEFRVLKANNTQYKTDLLVTSALEGEVDYTGSKIGPFPRIAAGGAMKVEKFGGDGIGMVTVTAPHGARVSTYIESRNPAGVFTSFEVAALTGTTGSVRLSPLESSVRYTYVVTINEGDKAANMGAKIINANGVSVGVEHWTAPPGVSLHQLVAAFDVGSAEVGQVQDCFGGWCSGSDQPVTIFATVNTPAGGAPRVIYP